MIPSEINLSADKGNGLEKRNEGEEDIKIANLKTEPEKSRLKEWKFNV